MLISYIRVSSQGQVQGDGLDRQRDVVRAWARNHGSQTIRGEFVEAGFTGTAFERPALGDLMAHLRILRDKQTGDLKQAIKSPMSMLDGKGGMAIDDTPTVLIERSDRLARDNLAAELILQEFRNLGVRVIDCEADLDLTNDDDPSKVLIRQILQAVAEFDKSSLVKKLRKARDRKRAKDGRCEGAKPYGTMEGEGVVLGTIKTLRLQHHDSIRAIRDYLNESGFKARSGRPWSAGSVGKIVQRIDREGEAG